MTKIFQKSEMPRGLPGGGGWAVLELTGTLIFHKILCDTLKFNQEVKIWSKWHFKEIGDKNKTHLSMELYSPTDILHFQNFVFPIVGQTSSGYHKQQFILSIDLSGIAAG